MRFFRFSLSLVITSLVLIGLANRVGALPPLGKLLDPFHGFWQNINPKDIPDDLESPKLSSAVTLHFDSLLVPHIYADNQSDLFFAQGFITAYHRYFQMDIQVRSAAGRISEVMGEDFVEYDRLQRRKGLTFAAENAVENYKDDPIYHDIMSFTQGVNSYVDQLDYRNFPIELKLLDLKPEPWTALKTSLVLSYMSDMLSGRDSDLENSFALRHFGRDTFNLLYPEVYGEQDPVAPLGMQWDFDPVLELPVPEHYPPEPLYESPSADQNRDNGSNNFALAPEKTVNGNTMLANDPHLGLNLPSIWYRMHLSSPGMNVHGVALMGCPGIIIGFNEDMAWGVTNSTRDVRDWYLLEPNADTSAYRYKDDWLPFEKRVEKIDVRYGHDFYDTVLYSHYGPVTYDPSFKKDGNSRLLAMKWNGHEPNLELKCFLEFNRGKNYDDYLRAISYYNTPAQNFIYADKDNNIAITVGGNFPVKWAEQGKFILDGSNPDHEWKMMIPRNQAVMVKNPERNFVSSANQRPVDTLYPYYVYDDHYENYRNRIVNQSLQDMDSASLEDLMGLQHSNFSLKAQEICPLLLSQLEGGQITEAFEILRSWDYLYDPESKAPAIFNYWWLQTRTKIWDEIQLADKPLPMPDEYTTYLLMKNHPELPFYDIQSTPDKESLRDIVQISWKETVQHFDQEYDSYPQWYTYKNTTVRHLLRLPAFSKSSVKIGGDRNIVNATSSGHGSSWRYAVEFTDKGPEAYGIYPGGQSGHPASSYYDNFIPRWANGGYDRMHLDPPVDNMQQVLFKPLKL